MCGNNEYDMETHETSINRLLSLLPVQGPPHFPRLRERPGTAFLLSLADTAFLRVGAERPELSSLPPRPHRHEQERQDSNAMFANYLLLIRAVLLKCRYWLLWSMICCQHSVVGHSLGQNTITTLQEWLLCCDCVCTDEGRWTKRWQKD